MRDGNAEEFMRPSKQNIAFCVENSQWAYSTWTGQLVCKFTSVFAVWAP